MQHDLFSKQTWELLGLTKKQIAANKSALSRDLQSIVDYVHKYRNSLEADVFSSQKFSIKLLQVPKVSNTSRADLAVEFVPLSQIEEDINLYEQVAVIVKDKRILREGLNVGRLKPKAVRDSVNLALGDNTINYTSHKYFYNVFSVRPPANAEDPFDTNAEFCLYDEPHDDYVYTDTWVSFIVNVLQAGNINVNDLKRHYDSGEKLKVADFKVD